MNVGTEYHGSTAWELNLYREWVPADGEKSGQRRVRARSAGVGLRADNAMAWRCRELQ